MRTIFGRIILVAGLALFALTSGCGQATAPTESGKGSANPPGPANSGAAGACSLLSQQQVADLVGNPVMPGRPFAGPQVCKWDTEDPDHVSVLLTVHAKGSIRETTLCGDLRKGGPDGVRLQGVGEVAVWKFSRTAGLFNSGDLDACGPQAFVSVSLNGKRDEPALRQAATGIAQKAFQRP